MHTVLLNASRSKVFGRELRKPSKIIEVVLPRPLGIIFEEDAARQRVVVSAFVPGSHADQLTKACLERAALLSLLLTLVSGPRPQFSQAEQAYCLMMNALCGSASCACLAGSAQVQLVHQDLSVPRCATL